MPECLPIVLAYIEHNGAVLLTLRPTGTHQGGRWEFPGGKVEPGETHAAALQREMREEVGISIAVGEEITTTCYKYPDRCVELYCYRCQITAGEPEARQVAAVRWVPRTELSQYDFPPANAALLRALDR